MHRVQRVASLIHQNIAYILLQDIGIPEFKWVTITNCVMRKDLKVAYIYYTVIQNKIEPKRIERLLEKNKSMIKKFLVKKVRIRFMPDLIFKPDPSSVLDEKFREIHK